MIKIHRNQIEKIIFFNNFNNGDIHYSREFIKFFSKEIGVPSFVNHKKCRDLLKDTQIPFIQANLNHLNQNGFYFQNGVLFMNTWIGQEGGKWIQQHPSGCTLKNNYKMFLEKAKVLEIEMPDEENFIPSINYDFFNIESLTPKNKKNVFISNGPCFSGQSNNFDMSNFIINLAKSYPKILFYVTQKIDTNLENIIDANETIKKEKNLSNLNELSYISTHCDIVVGRASGPYCFSHTKQNLQDNKKTYIVTSNNEREGHWVILNDYDNIKNKSKQIWLSSNQADIDKKLFLVTEAELNKTFER